MADKLFNKYGFSAFISYATEDDTGRNSFVSCFADELDLALPGRVRGLGLRDVTVPNAHLSGDDPLVAGSLGELLRKNVAGSFAMFLFVHDNYNLSDWCLKELEYFSELFGKEGFRKRLYVVAMSKNAIDKLTGRDNWKKLCPFEDQLWKRFYQNEAKDKPLEIYRSQGRGRRTVVATDFWTEFEPVLDDLAARIHEAAQEEPRAVAYPTSEPLKAVSLPEDKHLVRVYIESDPEQKGQYESLGVEVETSWDRVIAARNINPRLYLRPSGLAMSDIDKRPRLDDADGVVLLWNSKTPASVAAQIKKVEPKLVGPKPAPGLIAYVMKQADDLPAGMSIFNWNVVRFQADAKGAVTVLPADAQVLEEFFKAVLARKESQHVAD